MEGPMVPPRGNGSSRESLIGLLKEMDRRYDERFTSADKAVAAALAAADKAVAAALAAAKEAVIKTEAAAEKRFTELSELRQVVADSLGRMMPRNEAEAEGARIREKMDDHARQDAAAHTDENERIAALDKKIDALSNRDLGHKDTSATLRANIALIVSAAFLLLTLLSWLGRTPVVGK
jgi:hypothetical protein